MYLYFLAISSRSIGWFLTVVTIRTAIAVTTFLILLYKHYDFAVLKTQTPWRSIFAAAALDVGAFSLYNYTIANYEVSTVTMITSLQAAVIVLFSWIVFKEKLNRQQFIGLGVAIAGLFTLQVV